MKTIRVPDIDHPTLCWVPQNDPEKPKLMARCGLPKGHPGPHAWER